MNADDGHRQEAPTVQGVEAGAAELTQLLQIFIKDRERLETELAEERRRRDRDMEDHLEQMSEEMRSLRSAGPAVFERTPPAMDTPKLTKLSEADDIEAYLTTFERLMQAYEVDSSRWALKLAPQLTGKAQLAYAAMDTEQTGNYDTLKAAILRRYEISDETYRQHFRTAKRKGGEMQAELATRLKDAARKWLKDCSTRDDLLDAVVREQFLNTLDAEAGIWVMECKPKSSTEAGRLADDYELARKQTERGPSRSGGVRKCHNCGAPGHFARDCQKGQRSDKTTTPAMGKETPLSATAKPRRDPVKCYNCGQTGHISRRCPSNAALFGREEHTPPPGPSNLSRRGLVEGQAVRDILLDTGCSKTLVRSDLVPAEKLLEGDAVTIRCAHGDTALYPLAEVTIEVDGVPLQVEVAVSETLPVSVLLGTDVPELGGLINGTVASRTAPPPADALVVVTRTQTQRQQEEETVRARRQQESGVRASALADTLPSTGTMREEMQFSGEAPQPTNGPVAEPHMGVEQTTHPSLPRAEEMAPVGSQFADDLFTPGRDRRQPSRREKRAARQHFASGLRGQAMQEAVPNHPLDIPAAELHALQESDSTLGGTRQAADGEPTSARSGFLWQNGLLYRRWQPAGQPPDAVVEQLVLPHTCRPTVLQLAHTIPLAGHLGRDKTTQRILHRFYWPTLFKDVADYVRSCPECQKAGSQRVRRAPLIPLPVIGVPFERMAMDIVGPLPRSRSGNRYVLVVCDYATRYPEAVPICGPLMPNWSPKSLSSSLHM